MPGCRGSTGYGMAFPHHAAPARNHPLHDLGGRDREADAVHLHGFRILPVVFQTVWRLASLADQA